MLTPDELYGGRDVPAEKPHDEPLLGHLHLHCTLRHAAGAVRGTLDNGVEPLSLVTHSSPYLDNPDSGLQLLLPGDGQSVELPVVECGLDRLAGLQHVAVPHGGGHSRSSPGLSLYLQSDK